MGESKSAFQLRGSIGIKALIIVAAVAIVHHWYLVEFPDTEEMTAGTFTYGLSCFAAAIASSIIAKRYWGSEIFGKTYLALAIAFFLQGVGDFTYIYYDWYTDEAPYPSIAEVFFLLYYPFAGFHLVRNIKYFKKDLKWGPKIGVAGLTIIIVGIFAALTYEMIEESPIEFYLGLLFALASAVIFSLAILGASVFRDSILGTAWLILAGGIFIFTVADIWYYYLEVFDGYTGVHFVNTLWVLGNTAIIYALYKHKKTI